MIFSNNYVSLEDKYIICNLILRLLNFRDHVRLNMLNMFRTSHDNNTPQHIIRLQAYNHRLGHLIKNHINSIIIR